MSRTLNDGDRVQSELAELRAALRTVQAPEPDEAALRAEFREAARRRAQTSAGKSRFGGSWRVHVAAAAVVVLAVTAVFAAVLLRVEWPVLPSAAVVPQPLTVGAFQPLQNSPGFSPSDSYSVVRVRIPLSSFALVAGSEYGGTIEADLLVGEDGLARGIRFNQADTMLVSAGQ